MQKKALMVSVEWSSFTNWFPALLQVFLVVDHAEQSWRHFKNPLESNAVDWLNCRKRYLLLPQGRRVTCKTRRKNESNGKGQHAHMLLRTDCLERLRLLAAPHQIELCIKGTGIEAQAALEDLKTTLELRHTWTEKNTSS
jgi:hypothetical protein